MAAATPRHVRLPVSFGMLLTGETLLSWGPEGKVVVERNEAYRDCL